MTNKTHDQFGHLLTAGCTVNIDSTYDTYKLIKIKPPHAICLRNSIYTTCLLKNVYLHKPFKRKFPELFI